MFKYELKIGNDNTNLNYINEEIEEFVYEFNPIEINNSFQYNELSFLIKINLLNDNIDLVKKNDYVEKFNNIVKFFRNSNDYITLDFKIFTKDDEKINLKFDKLYIESFKQEFSKSNNGTYTLKIREIYNKESERYIYVRES